MPGYGTSDELEEVMRENEELRDQLRKRFVEQGERDIERLKKIVALEEEKRQLMLEEKKRVEREFCVMPHEYIKGMTQPVESCPTFKFALMDDAQFLPSREHDTDTGWDVRAAEEFTLKPFDHALIPLGFQMLVPQGWWLELRPRSSSHAKKNLHCLYGVIDEGYREQCYLSAQYIPPMHLISVPPDNYLKMEYGYNIPELVIERGERIGQVIPVRRQEMIVEEVSGAEFRRLSKERAGNRGGGLGSTG